MRQFHFIVSIVFISAKTLNAQSPCREVVAYYPNWQWYDRGQLVNPATLDYSQYSIINYAFFDVAPSGELVSTDPWADKNLLLGPINWSVAPAGYEVSTTQWNADYHHPGQQFSDYCHEYGVKLLPSIGGWTLSANIPAVAGDPIKRQTFAAACVDLVTTFGFDGIDLDWEYPGYAPHGGTPDDKTHFTLLLNELRQALDAAEALLGRELLLTIAVGAAPERMENIDWAAIIDAVDIINLMSYDYFGSWDALTNHNAPLYAPTQGDPEFNVHASVQRLLTEYSVPSSKITLGIGFYGRSVITNGAPGLHVASSGQPDNVTFGADEGTPLYYTIDAALPLFDVHWDENAQVPYLTGADNLNTFVSFDNAASVALKAQYAVDQNLRGAIIWEITGDCIESAPGSGVIAQTPLAEALNSVFCTAPAVSCLGDFDADGLVGTSDLLLLLASMGCVQSCLYDLNGAGMVNSADVLVFLGLFGTTCE